VHSYRSDGASKPRRYQPTEEETMNATPEAKAFVRRIRNANKAAYARSYLLWLCQEGRDYVTGEPRDAPRSAGASYMADQGVRMTLDRMMGRLDEDEIEQA
jgi:hypothetical protein